jgi:hypothetical protein
MKYEIASGNRRADVVKSVAEYLDLGYRPFGNLIYTGSSFCQAVVKED